MRLPYHVLDELVRGADLKLLSGTRLCWRISFAFMPATDPRPPSF